MHSPKLSRLLNLAIKASILIIGLVRTTTALFSITLYIDAATTPFDIL